MRNRRSIWALAALICALVVLFSSIAEGQQAATVPARVTQPVNLENLVTLRGNTHLLARPQYDQGAAPDSLPTERMLLVLQRSAQQETALRKLLDQQQVKSSPNYHMWLTPEQFGEQFGPADADIQAVTDWLTSQGFQVNQVAAGRTVIEFSGTAGQVRQALHTQIHKYVVHGEEHWANSSDPQIPAALAPVVAGFASLNNFPRKPMSRMVGTFTRSKETGKLQPQFTFPVTCPSGSGSATCYELGVGPGDFAIIYNLSPLYSASTAIDGTGQTISIVAQTNINLQDVADFRTMFGLPANTPNIILNGPDPGIIPPTVSGDEGESDLDVEWSGAVARGATIDLVVSQTTEVTAGIDLSALYIIDNNLAPVMSESYGACEAAIGTGGVEFYNTVWEQGAAEGITILEAAGDSGSAGCDDSSVETAAEYGLMVDGLATTPFNVAVGGTDFNDSSSFSTYWSTTNNSTTQASALSYIPEMTWNDTCASTGSTTGCASAGTDTPAGIDLVAGSGGPSDCINPLFVDNTFEGCSPSSTSPATIYGIPKPSWQSGTGVPNDLVRDIPDVSMFAGDGLNASFYIFCEIDANAFLTPPGSSTSCDLNSPYTNFQGAGGTSGSAQVFGGIMALVNQKYGRQGVANYVLYPLAAQSGASCESDATMAPTANSSSCIFYDIQTGNNSVACVADSANCSNQSTTGVGYGILINPNVLIPQPAWITTPGYDLATGLGTVNAANLVNNWNSVSFTPTATTLTLTAPSGYTLSNIPHGQPVTVTVNVSSTSGGTTPTGDVALLGGPSGYNATCPSAPCNLGIDFATLTNGAVSGTTVYLPGGTYGVTARYAGDGTHAASESSPPQQITVTPENSGTLITLETYDPSTGQITGTNVTSLSYGTPDLLRMDVTNSTGNLCYSSSTGIPAYQCPTGQVTVTLNGSTMPPTVDVGAPADNTPGTYTLNSQGTTEDQFIQLPVGSNALVATYEPHPVPPNNSYNQSASSSYTVTVTQASSTNTVSGPTSAASGANVTLTATVATTGFGLAPTGSVTFYNGSSLISGVPTYTSTNGSPTAVTFASLTATLTTSFTANASITAKYSGDANYAASTSPAFSLTITAQADFSLAASPTTLSLTPGESGVTVISASPLNGFTGTVNVTCTIPSAMAYTNCTLTPTSFSVSGTASGSSNLVIATTAPSTALHRYNGPRWFIPSAGALLAAIFLLLIPGRKRRAKLAFGLLVFALLAAAFVACGGGTSGQNNGNNGTGTGTYTVTVTGVSGNLSHTLNVTVSVI